MFRRILFLLFAATTLGAPYGLAAQVQTPTVKVLNEWIATFDSGDSGKLRAFWTSYGVGAPDEQVAHDLGLYGMTGGFSLERVLQDTGSHLVASVKDAHGGYAEITLDLASSDPPVIKGILGHPVPPPSAERSPATNDEELAKQVDAKIAELIAKDEFSGAVLVAHQDRNILERAGGFADRGRKLKNTMNTQFCLGSMNKMFTAVGVLQLVEAGKLRLDGVLADYWPDYPNHDLATRVHIRQLLNHTGGTGDIFTQVYEQHRKQLRSPGDYVKLFGSRPLAFEPGSKFEYSNYGYILLGRLIEIASGEDYLTYLRKHVYGPAGMTHTDSPGRAGSLRAIGYTRAKGQLDSNAATLPAGGTPAGGGYSTVGDLLLFAKALHTGKLLSPQLVQQATSDQSGHGYGFGFNVWHEGAFGHGGGAPGINGELRIPPDGYTVVVLENLDPPSATLVANFIEARVPAH